MQSYSSLPRSLKEYVDNLKGKDFKDFEDLEDFDNNPFPEKYVTEWSKDKMRQMPQEADFTRTIPNAEQRMGMTYREIYQIHHGM